MRQKNGYNKNPTARTFRCCFGTICSFGLMRCSENYCNCEKYDDDFINVEITLKDVQIETPPTEENTDSDDLYKTSMVMNPITVFLLQ